MTRLEAITTRLQPKEIEILGKYYKRVEKEGTQHFFWEKINEDLALDYSSLKALDSMGFVRLELEMESRGTVYTSYFLTLFSSAIYRAEYEHYSVLRQIIVRQYLNYKDWIAIAGFVIALGLAILKLIEFLTLP